MLSTAKAVDPRAVPVKFAMRSDIYTASPDAPLDEVLLEMADRKLGSCVVVLGDHVAGILTTVDVCTAFAEYPRGKRV